MRRNGEQVQYLPHYQSEEELKTKQRIETRARLLTNEQLELLVRIARGDAEPAEVYTARGFAADMFGKAGLKPEYKNFFRSSDNSLFMR